MSTTGLTVLPDKQALVRQKEAELAAVVDRHDDMVRELFHMERFVTLITGYDPRIAKKDRSQVFLDYQAPHDLVSRFAIQTGTTTARGSARTTRRALASVTTALALPVERDHLNVAGPSRPVNAVASGSGTGAGTAKRSQDSAGEDRSASSRRRRGVSRIPVKTEEAVAEDLALEEPEAEEVDSDGNESGADQNDADETPRKKRRPVPVPGPGEVLAYYIQPNGKKSHRKVVVNVDSLGADYILAERIPVVADQPDTSPLAPPRRHFTSVQAVASPPVPYHSARGTKRKAREPSPVPTTVPIAPPQPSRKKRKATPPLYVPVDPFAGCDVPPPRFTHHEQALEEVDRCHGSLGAYLNTYVMLEDKDADAKTLRDQANAAIRVKGRVCALGRQGRLLPFFHQDLEVGTEGQDTAARPETIGISAFKPPIEPKRLPGHRDHLLVHVTQVRNAILQEHRNAIAISRKNAKSVQVFWEREQGKEERQQKEADRALKASVRSLIKAIKARWKLAYKIVGVRAQARAKAEQERLGQEHLSSILNRSLGMLVETGSVNSPSSQPEERPTVRSREGSADQGQLDDDMQSDQKLPPGDGDSYIPGHAGSKADPDEVAGVPGVPEDPNGSIFGGIPPRPSDGTREAEGETADDDLELSTIPLLKDEPATVDNNESASSASPLAGPSRVPLGSSPPAATSSGDDGADRPENVSEDDHDLDVEMEAATQAKDGDSEDEGLLADAEVPIEELLRRYGYTQEVVDGIAKQPVSGDSKQDHLGDYDSEAATAAEAASLGPRRSIRSRRIRTIRDASSLAPMKRDLQDFPSDDGHADTDSGTDESSDSGRPVQEVEEADPDEIRVPYLLRATLRTYQKAGLDWLARSYRDGTNVILADDMGLGKTVQTIALLAHLACDLGEWGPHLIIVPTSVILNWEMEFKKFLPGFRVLTYYGSQKERKEKRKGWYLEGAFQVCITSYQIVLADQHIFKMRQWHYMILDEAHNIKNFRSQRWQTLLGFKSKRRLLLTGTPLQNNLMELWSLLYFLMPHGLSEQLTEAGGFANHREFIEWFSSPMDKAVETGDIMTDEIRSTVSKLHVILRPYMLRRLKTEVEKELPPKFEHVLHCSLSKRQRLLYDEFISRASTRESLKTGGYLGVANVLMKLRQVCNHPDLFEVRPIRTSFAMDQSVIYPYRGLLGCLRSLLADGSSNAQVEDKHAVGLHLHWKCPSSMAAVSSARLDAEPLLRDAAAVLTSGSADAPYDTRTVAGWKAYLAQSRRQAAGLKWLRLAERNKIRCSQRPVIGLELIRAIDITTQRPRTRKQQLAHDYTLHDIRKRHDMTSLVWNKTSRDDLRDVVDVFAIATPAVVARDLPQAILPENLLRDDPALLDPEFDTLHRSTVKLQIAFPDTSLLQYDCGKLQLLATMLRKLKAEGHRVLIFTVMTRMLDILEIFLNHSGHRYFRLDGSTKVEDRLILTERFNTNPKVFAFIASTRSGGVGINLTGADTVIFYDSDFNPAMDKQAMDRAHRIGQTREVHVYRMVTEHTVEENMLRKANQKRLLDELVIQKGDFTTDFFAKTDLRDYLPEEILDAVPTAVLNDVGGGDSTAGMPLSEEEIDLAFAEVVDEEDLANARHAAMDDEADAADFGTNDVKAAATGSEKRRRVSSSEPGRTLAPPGIVPSDPGTPTSLVDPEGQLGTETNQEGVEEEDAYDEEPGAVDEYMLRFAEWDWS